MTITHIVLGSLNIIAAAVMLWFAGQSAYARAQWTHHMRAYEQMRDGLNTGEWIRSLDANQLQLLRTRVTIDESTFYALPEAERAQIMSRLRGATEGESTRPASEAEIRSAIASLFWNTGQRTVVTKRGETKEYQVTNDEEYQKRNPPSKLLINPDPNAAAADAERANADIVRLAGLTGPRGFTKLVRAAIEQQYPRIEQEVKDATRRLYFSRARLADITEQQNKVKADVALLVSRRDVEQQLLGQAEAENLARRREITRLQADVEEALAAYTTALGRELDRQKLYAELKLKSEQTTNASDKLVNEIQKKELSGGGQ